MKRVDTEAARAAFDHAVATHRQAFGEFFLARLLGFEVRYADDRCEVRFPVRDFLFNPQGSLHGGIVALAMDVSMGHLLHHLRGAGATLEMKVQYLRPLRAGSATATGSILRLGGSLAFLESRLTDDEGALCAVATSTWKLLDEKAAGADGQRKARASSSVKSDSAGQ
jgi:uncharacterized protein (TIGR00369 family)